MRWQPPRFRQSVLRPCKECLDPVPEKLRLPVSAAHLRLATYRTHEVCTLIRAPPTANTPPNDEQTPFGQARVQAFPVPPQNNVVGSMAVCGIVLSCMAGPSLRSRSLTLFIWDTPRPLAAVRGAEWSFPQLPGNRPLHLVEDVCPLSLEAPPRRGRCRCAQPIPYESFLT